MDYAMERFTVVMVAIQSVLLIYAAWADLATRLIPNRICLALATSGAISQLFAGPVTLAISVAISGGVFLVLLLLHSFRLLGGGDVKLLTAMAITVPPLGIMNLFAYTAFAGGALAVVHLLMRRLPRPHPPQIDSSVFRRVYAIERWRILRHAPLPYGIAIACGGICTMMHTIGV
jgi:prepilin peptidase CpaA